MIKHLSKNSSGAVCSPYTSSWCGFSSKAWHTVFKDEIQDKHSFTRGDPRGWRTLLSGSWKWKRPQVGCDLWVPLAHGLLICWALQPQTSGLPLLSREPWLPHTDASPKTGPWPSAQKGLCSHQLLLVANSFQIVNVFALRTQNLNSLYRCPTPVTN